MYKFEKLEVWQRAPDYIDEVYALTEQLPRTAQYNLTSQMRRAATSIALNIAEGSTGQTDREQARFLGMAIRSLIETVACQHLISRRGYIGDAEVLRQAYRDSEKLVRQLQAMRRAIDPERKWVREDSVEYEENG